ncbi:thermonuclease family protein [Mycoplasma zalophi]|uniref:Thermonuclease family protein n=1 Tax=Mycoplasma zalophi TaxID=191287 RepID=A0ABS6DQA9_9MOLU|nr:thermonuclease family protein [Mycoplasma zalophi]MBU4691295.1 thermonuclease family protein [Mycoplasma zalophi]MBU4692499.1 thermonuclease family protein [Mycoplasma zalophi]
MKTKKQIKWLFIFFQYIFLGLSVTSCFYYQNNNTKNIQNKNLYSLTKETIKEVIDGDTLKTSKNELIRLQGIDTPESRRWFNNTWKSTHGIENSWALKAKNFLKQIILTNKNLIYMDRKFQKYDRYKRTVTQIFDLNKKSINLKMIKKGLARVNYISLNYKSIYYTKNVNYYYQLLDKEQLARKNKCGFWAQYEKIDQIFKSKAIKN